MTTTRNDSAAATPTGSPTSRAHSRMRSSSLSGSLIWVTWARSASTFRPIVAVDVDVGRRLVRPEEVEPPDDVGGQAGAGEPGERHRVAGRRIDGVDGGHAGGPVVGVVDATVAVEDDLGIAREDGVGTERPDLADEQLAQGEIVRQGAVGLVEIA